MVVSDLRFESSLDGHRSLGRSDLCLDVATAREILLTNHLAHVHQGFVV